MMEFLKSFIHEEDGAITVDWVVLTAALVGLALAAIATLRSSTDAAIADIDHAMGHIDLGQ